MIFNNFDIKFHLKKSLILLCMSPFIYYHPALCMKRSSQAQQINLHNKNLLFRKIELNEFMIKKIKKLCYISRAYSMPITKKLLNSNINEVNTMYFITMCNACYELRFGFLASLSFYSWALLCSTVSQLYARCTH